MDEVYLPRVNDGRWAIGREVFGKWVHLIQDTPTPKRVAKNVLLALEIEPSDESFDRYFPIKRGTRGHRPTLKLLELFARLGSTKSEVGV